MTKREVLEQLKRDELADDFIRRGYSVDHDVRVGSDTYDLVATKDAEKIAVAVKAASQLASSATAMRQLRERAMAYGFSEFRLSVATEPKKKTIEIEGLDNLLLEFMLNDVPNELDQLSTHTRVEDVAEVELFAIHVGHDGIHASGSAAVEVSLQYGSDSDDQSSSSDSYPFEFEVHLSLDMQTVSAQIEVDTSSFYE